MKQKPIDISRSIEVLKAHLDEIFLLHEWAVKMGYENRETFHRDFRSHYGVYPKKVLNAVQITSIARILRQDNTSGLDIAKKHSLRTENALNNFVNYHVKCSPTKIKEIPKQKLIERIHTTFRPKLGIDF